MTLLEIADSLDCKQAVDACIKHLVEQDNLRGLLNEAEIGIKLKHKMLGLKMNAIIQTVKGLVQYINSASGYYVRDYNGLNTQLNEMKEITSDLIAE